MVSFLFTEKHTRQEKIVKNVSDFFRFFGGRGRTEPGDWLQSGFVHYFTEEEIKEELQAAGYRIVGFNKVDYGCIIATPQA